MSEVSDVRKAFDDSLRRIDFQVGWLERATKGYNISVVNQYVKLFSSVLSGLSEKLRFREPLLVKVFDGMLLTGKELRCEAWDKYERFLSRREGLFK